VATDTIVMQRLRSLWARQELRLAARRLTEEKEESNRAA
jgi:hypothetical protein